MSILNDDRSFGTDEERREWKQEADSEYRKQKYQDMDREEMVSRANLISKLEILERRYGSDFYWETRKIVDKLPSVKPQEPKTEKVIKMRDATPEEQEAVDKYIKSISKPTGVNFWNLAGGEYISKEKAIIQLSWDLSEVELPRIKESLDKLPSVDIPPEHDGCKDCRWQSQSKTEMPCKQCKQNYKDEWQKKPHWIMKHRTINEVKYHTGLDDMGEEHTIKELIRYEVDEPYCSECGMKAGDTSQNYCCFCGVKMGGEQDG